MEYNFREIEKKWREYWIANKVYKVDINDKPKYYVLDMFPYPSGAGLHVGHPLGYIASDIYSRYKRLQGFNVLHPMGYDAYGLPAEQYAIQTGQHPAITTVNNINRYRDQLDKIGFSFDWSREVRTCDPKYYHWTQWAFQKMFKSFYSYEKNQARPIEELIAAFEQNGTAGLDVACSEELNFTAEEWKAKSEKEQQEILMNYRIAYLGETMVNWCPQLGTVLANDEVVDNSLIDHVHVFPLELNTMPGFAGSSAYYLRYMDPNDDQHLVSKEADEYWQNVDLYIGGTEHATGHLIYSRFWNKFLHDLGVSIKEEPFQKLINQGMIQGRSNFVYRIKDTNTFVSLGLKDQYDVTPLHVDVNIVSNDILDLEAFKNWRPEYNTAEFILEDGKYVCGWAVEKMSKSMFNVVNPDVIVEKYGADTLRLYEMFLGPIEQSKPWDTNGIDGVHRFLKRLWGLFYGNSDTLQVNDAEPTAEELKSLHKLIKKVTSDIEHFSYNTSISAFMICVNELGGLKCSKKAILEPLIVVLAPFAPHIAEELWHELGHGTTVCDAQWPKHEEKYLVENSAVYAISFNGKVRFNLELPADMPKEEVEKTALTHEYSAKWLEGKTIKKVIVVPKKIVNIVIG